MYMYVVYTNVLQTYKNTIESTLTRQLCQHKVSFQFKETKRIARKMQLTVEPVLSNY